MTTTLLHLQKEHTAMFSPVFTFSVGMIIVVLMQATALLFFSGMKRVEFAGWLVAVYRVVTQTEPASVPTPFTDIQNLTEVERQNVAKLYGLGITHGITPDQFGPERKVSVPYFFTFLSNFLVAVQKAG